MRSVLQYRKLLRTKFFFVCLFVCLAHRFRIARNIAKVVGRWMYSHTSLIRCNSGLRVTVHFVLFLLSFLTFLPPADEERKQAQEKYRAIDLFARNITLTSLKGIQLLYTLTHACITC